MLTPNLRILSKPYPPKSGPGLGIYILAFDLILPLRVLLIELSGQNEKYAHGHTSHFAEVAPNLR